VVTEVEGEYVLLGGGEVGFQAGPYDRTRALVIDPVLTYSSFLGGAADDAITAMALDAAGNIYVAGWTSSTDLPAVNARQTASGGGVDAFVAKLDPSGKNLIYATYLGGRYEDRASGIAVDSTGYAVVTGWTQSPTFPQANAVQSALRGSRDAFVAKLNAQGSALIFGTFLGGGGVDRGNAVAVDASGNIYVAGATSSVDFPVLAAFRASNRGQQDAFLVKLTPSGSFVYSTYLGGERDDSANAVAVDAAGNAYIGGGTNSPDFPVAGALQASNRGGQDGFIAKLAPSGSSLVYSTYLGGSAGITGFPEEVDGIAVDSGGNAYVAGVTSSADFPVVNPFQAAFGGYYDAFAARLNASGSALVYSTYLGGSSADSAAAIAIDGAGNAYIAGATLSVNFPVSSALQSRNSGVYNAFAAKLSASGGSLLFGTYLGGESSDAAKAVAVDSGGNFYLAGQTLSYNFPTVAPLQVSNPGGYGGFIANVRLANNSQPRVVSASPSSGAGQGGVFTFVYADADGYGSIDEAWFRFGTECSGYYSKASNALTLASGAGMCTLNASQSSAIGAGDTLTVKVSLTFLAAFSGDRALSLMANAEAGVLTSGWVAAGSWTVKMPARQTPRVIGVSPSGGSGSSQVFTFTYADGDGYALIDYTHFDIYGNGLECFGHYNRNANALYLMNDTGTQWLGPLPFGTSATIQNSRCVLNSSGSSVFGSSDTLTLKVSITFQPAFAGSKSIALMASAGGGSLSSDWRGAGSWIVGP
jgi:hypothetical protein